jgi:flagellar basal body-associated protein FliL
LLCRTGESSSGPLVSSISIIIIIIIIIVIIIVVVVVVVVIVVERGYLMEIALVEREEQSEREPQQ